MVAVTAGDKGQKGDTDKKESKVQVRGTTGAGVAGPPSQGNKGEAGAPRAAGAPADQGATVVHQVMMVIKDKKGN